MFGTQKKNQIRNFIVRKGIAESRHFLAAVFDLIGDLSGFQALPDIGQRRPLLRSGRAGAMTVRAALVSEEFGSRRLGSFGRCMSSWAGSDGRAEQCHPCVTLKIL